MSDRNRLIDKLTKMLAKAEGTTNKAEAETFMHKVHQLLEQHNISLHELGDTDDPIHRDDKELEVSRSLSYAVHLLPALGAYYGCEVVFHRGHKKNRFICFGRQSATMTFHLMAPFVLSQVRAQARQLEKEGKIETYGKGLTAVANALTYRLNRLYWENKERDEERVATGERALVSVDRVEALVAEHYPELKQNNHKPQGTTRAAVDAANKIGIHRQTEHTPQGLIK